jgi:hypothetical protein
MPTSHQNHAKTSAKAGGKTITAERALVVRLQELGVDPGGLPHHVTAHLRALVDDEAKRVSDALAAKIAELEAKSGEQLRNQVARVVTFKSVGKAFAMPTAKPPGGAAK